MIEVKGPNVFKGYWRMPEKTAAEFRDDGFFITGDLGKIDDARLRPHRRPRQGSRHHRRLQRLSEGNRERDRRACRAWSRCAVIGVPHPDFGEGVTAVVVRDKGAAIDEAAGARRRSTAGSPSSSMPKRVIFVDDLPRNTMGKVQKNVLRETYKDIYK